MHATKAVDSPDSKSDLRKRCRYRVYKSSNCVFSPVTKIYLIEIMLSQMHFDFESSIHFTVFAFWIFFLRCDDMRFCILAWLSKHKHITLMCQLNIYTNLIKLHVGTIFLRNSMNFKKVRDTCLFTRVNNNNIRKGWSGGDGLWKWNHRCISRNWSIPVNLTTNW